jgi:dipeptidyl aminopeptidase/acylaminoacyl peptidase
MEEARMPDVREAYEMVTKEKAPEPGALERQQKRQVRSGRNKRFGAFAVAAAIAVAAVALILETRRGPNTRTPADQPSAVAPGTVSGPFFLDLRTGEKIPLAKNLAGSYSYVASPDGTRLAFSSSRGGGCSAADGITIVNIDGTGSRTLKPPKGLIYCSPRWSPDGTKLVYQERAATEDSVGNLFVHDLSTGRRTQVTDLKLSRAFWWFLSPRFTPTIWDSFAIEPGPGHVIFHLPRSSTELTTWDVWSVPVTGGEPTLVLRDAAFPLPRAQGPEGLGIQFVLPKSNDFAGQSLMTGRPIPDSDIRQPLVQAKSSIWWPTMSPDGRRIAYQDGGSIYVLHIDTFSPGPLKVADGNTAEWFDNHTLIVAP